MLRSVQTTSGPISAPLQGCSRWVWRDPLSGAGSLCGAAAARLDRSMELFCRLPAEEPRWCRRHHHFRSHLMVIQHRRFLFPRCGASNSSSMASCLKLTFVACSTLVRRPRSGRNRASLLETIRRGRANPTRKRIFGGAWVHSATVRSCTHVRPLLPVRTDGVLFAHVAVAYSRCPCT